MKFVLFGGAIVLTIVSPFAGSIVALLIAAYIFATWTAPAEDGDSNREGTESSDAT